MLRDCYTSVCAIFGPLFSSAACTHGESGLRPRSCEKFSPEFSVSSIGDKFIGTKLKL